MPRWSSVRYVRRCDTGGAPSGCRPLIHVPASGWVHSKRGALDHHRERGGLQRSDGPERGPRSSECPVARAFRTFDSGCETWPSLSWRKELPWITRCGRAAGLALRRLLVVQMRDQRSPMPSARGLRRYRLHRGSYVWSVVVGGECHELWLSGAAFRGLAALPPLLLHRIRPNLPSLHPSRRWSCWRSATRRC